MAKKDPTRTSIERRLEFHERFVLGIRINKNVLEL